MTDSTKIAQVVFKKYFEHAAQEAKFLFDGTLGNAPKCSTFLCTEQFLAPSKINDEVITLTPLTTPHQTFKKRTMWEHGCFALNLNGSLLANVDIMVHQFAYVSSMEFGDAVLYENISFTFDSNNDILLSPWWVIWSYYSYSLFSSVDMQRYQSTICFIRSRKPNIEIFGPTNFDSSTDYSTVFTLTHEKQVREEYLLSVVHKFDRFKYAEKYPLEYEINSFHPLVLFGVMNTVMNKTVKMLSSESTTLSQPELLE